jgi:thiamine kinase-like enzyme
MMWIDFEDVCLGPPEWDLATMMDEGAVAKYHDPDPEMLPYAPSCGRCRLPWP